jgi:hypothetical protein
MLESQHREDKSKLLQAEKRIQKIKSELESMEHLRMTREGQVPLWNQYIHYPAYIYIYMYVSYATTRVLFRGTMLISFSRYIKGIRIRSVSHMFCVGISRASRYRKDDDQCWYCAGGRRPQEKGTFFERSSRTSICTSSRVRHCTRRRQRYKCSWNDDGERRSWKNK